LGKLELEHRCVEREAVEVIPTDVAMLEARPLELEDLARLREAPLQDRRLGLEVDDAAERAARVGHLLAEAREIRLAFGVGEQPRRLDPRPPLAELDRLLDPDAIILGAREREIAGIARPEVDPAPAELRARVRIKLALVPVGARLRHARAGGGDLGVAILEPTNQRLSVGEERRPLDRALLAGERRHREGGAARRVGRVPGRRGGGARRSQQ
jgi:hypothetical protein